MAIGTNGNDTLNSTRVSDFISGLGGDDSLTSTHNDTFLNGGAGSDTLTSTTYASFVLLRVTQIGGSGNDSLSYSHTGTQRAGSDADLAAVLDGGDNNDTLFVSADNTGDAAVFSALQASGGSGADTFDLDLRSSSSTSADTQFVLDAGIGNDVITKAIATAQASGAATLGGNAEMYIDLGGGNDLLSSTGVGARSVNANTVTQGILAGSGSDTVVAQVNAASLPGTTGGSGAITQVIDGGAGNDDITGFVVSDQEKLDSFTGSSSLTGGNGADTLNSNVSVGVLGVSDFDGFFETGSGNDSVNIFHTVDAAKAGQNTKHDTTTDLGGSNDTLTADIQITSAGTIQATNTVNASQGFNDISFVTRATGGAFAANSTSIYTGGNADNISSETDARTGLNGTVLPTDYADARNVILSGGGNDTINAEAIVQSSGDALSSATPRGGLAVNSIDAGTGADDVTVRTFLLARQSDIGTQRAFAFIDGGTGKDTIDATLGTNSTFFVANFDFDSTIQGGAANDVITSTIDLSAATKFTGTSEIFGGSGSDNITTSLAFSSPAAADIGVTETTWAGAGLDTITATLDTSGMAAGSTGLPIIRLFGEAGGDTISATAIGSSGAFQIEGGDGDDVITLSNTILNPVQSILNGDAGNDTITGGTGREQINGGTGEDVLIASIQGSTFRGGPVAAIPGDGEADTFVFDPTIGQGSNTIIDFEAAHDILQFTGVVDAGAPGLADDIDALITTYSDFGPGTDRYIVLSSGTYIQFNDTGMGPGTFTSIADMVADPLTQLIA